MHEAPATVCEAQRLWRLAQLGLRAVGCGLAAGICLVGGQDGWGLPVASHPEWFCVGVAGAQLVAIMATGAFGAFARRLSVPLLDLLEVVVGCACSFLLVAALGLTAGFSVRSLAELRSAWLLWLVGADVLVSGLDTGLSLRRFLHDSNCALFYYATSAAIQPPRTPSHRLGRHILAAIYEDEVA